MVLLVYPVGEYVAANLTYGPPNFRFGGLAGTKEPASASRWERALFVLAALGSWLPCLPYAGIRPPGIDVGSARGAG